MELKYKPPFGAVMLVLGVALVATGSVVGILLGIIGLLMLTRPMVRLSPSSIGMKNMLGIEMRTHTGNFEVRDNKIFVDGKKKVSLWMFDGDEAAIRSYLDSDSRPGTWR